MLEAIPATGMDGEMGEVLVSLSNRVNEAWVVGQVARLRGSGAAVRGEVAGLTEGKSHGNG